MHLLEGDSRHPMVGYPLSRRWTTKRNGRMDNMYSTGEINSIVEKAYEITLSRIMKFPFKKLLDNVSKLDKNVRINLCDHFRKHPHDGFYVGYQDNNTKSIVVRHIADIVGTVFRVNDDGFSVDGLMGELINDANRAGRHNLHNIIHPTVCTPVKERMCEMIKAEPSSAITIKRLMDAPESKYNRIIAVINAFAECNYDFLIDMYKESLEIEWREIKQMWGV